MSKISNWFYFMSVICIFKLILCKHIKFCFKRIWNNTGTKIYGRWAKSFAKKLLRHSREFLILILFACDGFYHFATSFVVLFIKNRKIIGFFCYKKTVERRILKILKHRMYSEEDYVVCTSQDQAMAWRDWHAKIRSI